MGAVSVWGLGLIASFIQYTIENYNKAVFKCTLWKYNAQMCTIISKGTVFSQISVDNWRFPSQTLNSSLFQMWHFVNTHLVSMECMSWFILWIYATALVIVTVTISVRVVIPDCCIPFRLPVFCCRPLDDCTSLPYTRALRLYDCWDCFATELNALNNSWDLYDLLLINYTLFFTVHMHFQ